MQSKLVCVASPHITLTKHNSEEMRFHVRFTHSEWHTKMNYEEKRFHDFLCHSEQCWKRCVESQHITLTKQNLLFLSCRATKWRGISTYYTFDSSSYYTVMQSKFICVASQPFILAKKNYEVMRFHVRFTHSEWHSKWNSEDMRFLQSQ